MTCVQITAAVGKYNFLRSVTVVLRSTVQLSDQTITTTTRPAQSHHVGTING